MCVFSCLEIDRRQEHFEELMRAAGRFVWDFTMEIVCMGFYYGSMEDDQRL